MFLSIELNFVVLKQSIQSIYEIGFNFQFFYYFTGLDLNLKAGDYSSVWARGYSAQFAVIEEIKAKNKFKVFNKTKIQIQMNKVLPYKQL